MIIVTSLCISVSVKLFWHSAINPGVTFVHSEHAFDELPEDFCAGHMRYHITLQYEEHRAVCLSIFEANTLDSPTLIHTNQI